MPQIDFPYERFRFRVTSRWLEDAFAQANAWCASSNANLPINAPLFSKLFPLLAHGALDTDQPPTVAVDLDRIRSLFSAPTIRSFVEGSRTVTANPALALRRRDVGFSSPNPLSSRFVPTEGNRVPDALRNALQALDAALARIGGNGLAAVVSLWVGAQCLLAIHPFKDGNGRSIRAFFAATCLRHVGPAPSVVIAILLAHAAGGQRYHQAAWALRAGSVGPMIMLFIDAEAEAREYLMPVLGQVSIDECMLSECHGWLRSRLEQ